MVTSADLLVGNSRLITHDERLPYLEDGCVAIRDGLIAEVDCTESLRLAYPDVRFIDAQRRVLLPGLINTHTHLYTAFARGIALKQDAPGNFTEILERLWWRLDKTLTLEDVYWGAMVGMVDCIRNGVTTIFDHHASPRAIAGSLFRIAHAARATGLRSCLCYEVSDRDGPEVAAQGIEENRAFLQYCEEWGDDRLRGLFGLHASFTLSDATLASCGEAAAQFAAGFHVHTAEALSDAEHCRRVHGKSIVERWHDIGILSRKTLAAHCVHIDDHEMELLAASDACVVHNPESNMGNAVGSAPALKMMGRGVRVGLGTDGYTADMFESMKAAHLLATHASGDPRAGWAELPQMLCVNAELAGECFGGTFGKVAPGAHADLILVDYDPPTPMTGDNAAAHLHFGLSGRAVSTTMIGGRVVMQDGKLLEIDEAEVRSKARACADALWKWF